MIIDRLKYYLNKSWFYPIGIIFHPETLAIIIDKFSKKENISFRDRMMGIAVYASKNIPKGTFKIAKTSEELYKILEGN